MTPPTKNNFARSEKKIQSLLHTFFTWFDRMAMMPAAHWLNNWQNRVSIRTRNLWMIAGLGLLLLGGLYNLYVFISIIIE
jgi:hypothetical protein